MDKTYYVKIKGEIKPYIDIGHPVSAETRGKAISKRLQQLQEVYPDLKYTDLTARVG